MNFIDYIKKTIKITNIILTTSYHVIIYKLNLKTYSDTVINICNSLVNHSYIFIKVIQWGLQNVYDLNFDEKVTNYFNVFSNKVPYSTLELEKSILSLDKAVHYASTYWNDKLEIENNYVPINSGSVALVFKGLLNDKPIIIKVLRYNIIDIIEKDICFLEYFFDNIFVKNIIKYYIKINFKNFITINRSILLKQCNFKYEVNNALLFKNNLKNEKNIVIPHTYKHFTDAFHEIIVMEYLHGPIAKNVSLDELQYHFETMHSFYLKSLFQYNVLHGDFHLGNIIIIDKNTFGVIDFGIVYIVNNNISNKLFDISFLNLNKKKTNCLFHAIKIFIKMMCQDEKKIEEIFIKLKNDHELIYLCCKSKFSVNALIIILNKILSMDIKIDIEMSNLILSLMSTLQTLNNCVKYQKNQDKSLTNILKSYIKNI